MSTRHQLPRPLSLRATPKAWAAGREATEESRSLLLLLLPLSLRAQSRSLLLLLFLPLLLASCYKDEVAEADLTTNPFDQDYDGEPFLELLGDSTYRQFDNFGVPIDTVIEYRFRVRIDLFPSPTTYEPFGVQVNNGTEFTGPLQTPSDSEAFVLHRHVVEGNNYCMDVSIKSQGTNTRSYRFCATADL